MVGWPSPYGLCVRLEECKTNVAAPPPPAGVAGPDVADAADVVAFVL